MSYIKYCKICQWNKTPSLKLAGMLQPLEILDMHWEVVNMDFIYGLSPSTHGYDDIYKCVDKLSIMAHFNPITTHITIKKTRLFCDHVYKLHGCLL